MEAKCCIFGKTRCKPTFPKINGHYVPTGACIIVDAYDELLTIDEILDEINPLEIMIIKKYKLSRLCYAQLANLIYHRIWDKTLFKEQEYYFPALINLLYMVYGNPDDPNNKLRKFTDRNKIEKIESINNEDLSSVIEDMNFKKEIEATSKKVVTEQRIGQGVFKDKLKEIYKKCLLCDINNMRLLRASHIKDWASANDFERIDFYNGFLLCPNHDSVFNDGFITFSDKGELMISDELDEKTVKELDLKKEISVKIFEGNKKYLKYHREVIFKK
ncbi:HNH endonuclease [Clostridium botulinum]|uniref:HNH endonuclease n=1 Tax=Clostridium botulinum TaxID=1491 RepID=UPI0013F010AD|nr:HNH endonuclease [Clostridium botulinum]MBY6898547.1 hypothetical protein [Clostridium botulinum]MBY6912825.1 hypothetical protein [Clostridium botulinum]MCR1178726.1 hypothetical protein [Clostridium botulinum]NFM79750.1 hypothetical protein [Clostridium botulinum]